MHKFSNAVYTIEGDCSRARASMEDFQESVRQRLALQEQVKSGTIPLENNDDTLKLYRPFTICECGRLTAKGLRKGIFTKVRCNHQRWIERDSDNKQFLMEPEDFEGLRLMKCNECIQNEFEKERKRVMDEKLKVSYELFDMPYFDD